MVPTTVQHLKIKLSIVSSTFSKKPIYIEIVLLLLLQLKMMRSIVNHWRCHWDCAIIIASKVAEVELPLLEKLRWTWRWRAFIRRARCRWNESSEPRTRPKAFTRPRSESEKPGRRLGRKCFTNFSVGPNKFRTSTIWKRRIRLVSTQSCKIRKQLLFHIRALNF